MIIKVELYYELTRKGDTKFPEHAKAILEDKIKEEIPDDVTLEGDFWNGTKVSAHKLTREELHERIRNAK